MCNNIENKLTDECKQYSELEGYEREIGSDEESDDDGSWNEIGEEQELTKCLFCDTIGESIEKTIEHLSQQHHISIYAIKQKLNMDQYSYVKVSTMTFIKIYYF